MKALIFNQEPFVVYIKTTIFVRQLLFKKM